MIIIHAANERESNNENASVAQIITLYFHGTKMCIVAVAPLR